MNTTEHYIEGTVTHLSKYGGFGTITVVPPATPAPPPPTGGGGGGGGGVPPGVTLLSDKIQSNGIFTYDVTAKSEDKKCILEITHGVKGLTRFGQALSRITMVEVEEPAVSSESKYIIGKDYDIGPNGATFEPAITLTMGYDPESLSENVSEKELYIAYWDGSQWLAFES
ncbi:hypothetical protein ACFLV6_01360, partial [Chloroflexota bacterium]